MARPGSTVADRHNLVMGASAGAATLYGPMEIIAYTANGAISNTPGIKMLNKTSALASTTLPAPEFAGDYIFLICGTAFAHVVTATALIQDGVTGGAKTTITMGAFVGASIGLIGVSGTAGALTWAVTFKNVAVIS